MQEEILTLINNSTLTESEKEKALSYYNNCLRQEAPSDKIYVYDQDHLSKTPNALLGAYELFRIINNDNLHCPDCWANASSILTDKN